MRGARALAVGTALLLVLPAAAPLGAGPVGQAAGTQPVAVSTVEVQLEGVTARNLTVGRPRAVLLAGTVSSRLSVPGTAVRVDPGADNATVEVRAAVEPAALRAAIEAAGVEVGPDAVAPSVSRATRRAVATQVRERLAGVTGPSTVTPTRVAGRRGLAIRVRGLEPGELLSTALGLGPLRVTYHTPAGDSGLLLRRVTAVAAVTGDGTPRAGTGALIRLTERGQAALADARRVVPASASNATTCSPGTGGGFAGACVLVTVDGEVLAHGDLGAALGTEGTGGVPALAVTLSGTATVGELRRRLVDGTLVTPVTVTDHRATVLDPGTTRPARRGRVSPRNRTFHRETVELGTTLSAAGGPGLGPLAALVAGTALGLWLARRRPE